MYIKLYTLVVVTGIYLQYRANFLRHIFVVVQIDEKT